MERNKRLTVKEVIAELLKCNPDAEVIAESPYKVVNENEIVITRM